VGHHDAGWSLLKGTAPLDSWQFTKYCLAGRNAAPADPFEANAKTAHAVESGRGASPGNEEYPSEATARDII